MNLRFLSLEDVRNAGLTFEDGVRTVEASLRAHGERRVENPPKVSVHPCPDAFITAMPAHLHAERACGMKWVSGFPSNVPKTLPTIAGLIILNDPGTGLPLAFMDGTYITALRTVAVSAVSVKHLANPDSAVLGLVGCGVQGRLHAAGMARVLPSLSMVKAFDRHKPAADSFPAAMRRQAPALEVQICESAEDAIRDADLVITATGKLLEPIFHCAWVKPGTLVLAVHTQGWDDAVLAEMDKIIVDDWAQFTSYAGGFYRSLPSRPYAETGEIVAGLKAGRESRQERIVAFNTGLAVHDILMASVILERANARGLGTTLSLEGDQAQMPAIEFANA